MSNQTPQLKDSVLQRIQDEGVVPVTKGWFTCLECFVRVGWFVSVVLGAVAVALLSYTAIHGWYGFHEALDMSRIGYILKFIPLAWLVILVITIVLAYVQVRRSRRGYKYPVWSIVVGSIAVATVGGLMLNGVGFSQYLDMKLGEDMPMYNSYYKQQEQFWQSSQENRWLGTVTEMGSLTFADFNGQMWTLQTSYIGTSSNELLMDNKKVRLLGIEKTESAIEVCAVFPWYIDKPMSVEQLAADRKNLVSTLSTLKEAESDCATIEVLRRMP